MPDKSESVVRMAFNLDKATKNTFKYEERPESGQPPRIGRLYVQKWALGDNPPSRLTVTLEPGPQA
jgi:hypothetical protein